MKASKRKKLIIDLIANDLINTKLVLGLNATHIDASIYFLYLGKVILDLMGFKKPYEHMYHLYAQLTLRSQKLSLGDTSLISAKAMAQGIYEELAKMRRRAYTLPTETD